MKIGTNIRQIGGAMGGSARTFLTHLFGRGLDDDKYRVERYRSMADGMIRPWHGVPGSRSGAGKKTGKGKGTGKGKAGDLKLSPVVPLSTVRALRPEPNEIIVCTGVTLEDSGCQLWGGLATNLFIRGTFR